MNELQSRLGRLEKRQAKTRAIERVKSEMKAATGYDVKEII